MITKMKPVKLTHSFAYDAFNPGISQAWIKKFIRENFDTGNKRDSLQDCPVSSALSPSALRPPFDRLEAFLNTKGYTIRKSLNYYASCSLTYVSGCIEWHDDLGYGISASVLLYQNKRKGYDNFCQLLTRHGGLSLRIGDVFVFDASKKHAWLSNVDCLLAMMTIKKVRGKKLATDSII